MFLRTSEDRTVGKCPVSNDMHFVANNFCYVFQVFISTRAAIKHEYVQQNGRIELFNGYHRDREVGTFLGVMWNGKGYGNWNKLGCRGDVCGDR